MVKDSVKMHPSPRLPLGKINLVLTTVLTRHGRCRCSSEERGKRALRLCKTNVSGGSAVLVPNKKVAAIATGTNKIFQRRESSFPLPGGEGQGEGEREQNYFGWLRSATFRSLQPEFRSSGGAAAG